MSFENISPRPEDILQTIQESEGQQLDEMSLGEINPNDTIAESIAHSDTVQPIHIEEAAEEPSEALVIDLKTDDGRIEDKDLAWDMAHASKPERDKAVEKIEVASEHFAEYERRDRKDRGWKESGERATEKAAELDGEADRVEEWVKVLHEHPVSEAYLESHNVTARGLAALENNVSDWQSEIDSKLSQLDTSPLLGINGFDIGWRRGEPVNLIADAFDAVPGAGGSQEPVGVRLLVGTLDRFDREAELLIKHYDANPEGVEKLKAYREALENPETTLGQLRDMYTEAYTKKYVEPLRSKIENNQALLEEIRSGNASDSNAAHVG